MNRIFDSTGRELRSLDEIGKAFYAIMSDNIRQHPYPEDRIAGDMCECKGHGKFILDPLESENVQTGGKRYMKCSVCGLYSHL